MERRSISTLPPELLLQITTRLPFDGKRSLGSANSAFRKLLAPEIFQAVRVTNEEQVAKTVLSIAEKYGQHTEALFFQGFATPALEEKKTSFVFIPEDKNEDEAQQPETRTQIQVRTLASHDTVLPPDAAKLLGGKHLPNLRNVSIHFPVDADSDEWDGEDDLGPSGLFDDEEGAGDVQNAEAKYTWRALMAETYRALTSNERVKMLGLREFIPLGTSTFWDQKWRKFLGRLSDFELDARGFDNGAGWCSNVSLGYMDFMGKIDFYFLDHLNMARRVKLAPSDDAPLGLEGMNHASLAVKPSGQLSHLEILELENVFVGPELVEFLRGHAQILKALRLKNCMASSEEHDSMAENGISWAEFFACLLDSRPPLTLEELRINNSNVPITQNERYPDVYAEEEEEDEEVQQVRQMLRDDEHRKLFAYSKLDDKFGMVFESEEVNVEAFLLGEDQKEFDELMAVVVKNATAAQKNPAMGS